VFADLVKLGTSQNQEGDAATLILGFTSKVANML